MTVRFATARPISTPVHLTRSALGRIAARAANDNADLARQDQVVREALRHFAAYGLNAAEDAAKRARIAHGRGDAADLRHWLQICAALDPRRAAAMHRKLATLPR
ncbi:MAG: hypothetical protein ABL914_08475 [Novosphingobium sp.]|uniref:hypothetical protein n=1 Tax=Novosphingobium sp. TaxID=1874826 RepID=UPI0032B9FA3D